MKMQSVLLEERLRPGELPCYDKEPGVPSFVVDGSQFFDYGAYPSHVVDGVKVIQVAPPHRVHVPMCEGTDDATAKTLALIKTTAEHGSSGIDWEESFLPIRQHFDTRSLPLAVVIKNPTIKLDVPSNVELIDDRGVEVDRFYCLTRAELLGRHPYRLGVMGEVDERGYLIFNPQGVLTVFFEATEPSIKIP